MAIRVTLIDVATGQSFAQSDLPPEQLPHSFEADTTLHLGDADWSVVSAEPMTAAEFIATGALRLTLRKLDIQHIAPEKILYSLSTLNDAQPGIAPGSTKLGKRVLELHEDDWRQVELLAASQQPAIDRELAAIREVHAKERVGVGFRRLHLRSEIAAPLADARVVLRELAELPGATALDGISLRGVAGLLAGGFAFTLGGWSLYGVAEDGRVTTIGLTGAPEPPGSDRLQALAAAHRLVLVDWCAASQGW